MTEIQIKRTEFCIPYHANLAQDMKQEWVPVKTAEEVCVPYHNNVAQDKKQGRALGNNQNFRIPQRGGEFSEQLSHY
jgi:hypothetical protein